MSKEETMKSAQLDDFIDILNTELDLLSRLHAVLAEQQDALVAGQIDDISTGVEQQIAIVSEMARLEERREAVMDGLAQAGGDGPALEAILGVASENQAVRINGVVEGLRDALESLGTVNKRNGMLIRQSMSYIDRTVKLLASGGAPAETYTAEGGIESPTREVALNKRI